jgi:hypothetical protein|tara:strand:- start:3200 stop:3772 length:573 start_codon:yes stop_codon:yes gene_type:complete
MARTIGSTFSTQLSSSQTRPFYAVEFLYTQTLRVWTGYSEFTIDGSNYLGLGDLISVGQVEESADVKANGLNITLSGLDTSILAGAFNETQQGIVVNVKFGVLTTTDNALAIVDTPYQIFSGTVDTVSINEDGETSTIQYSIESKLISLEKALDFRYTDQDQKFFFPNDRGLEFVDDMQDKSIDWGGGDT